MTRGSSKAKAAAKNAGVSSQQKLSTFDNAKAIGAEPHCRQEMLTSCNKPKQASGKAATGAIPPDDHDHPASSDDGEMPPLISHSDYDSDDDIIISAVPNSSTRAGSAGNHASYQEVHNSAPGKGLNTFSARNAPRDVPNAEKQAAPKAPSQAKPNIPKQTQESMSPASAPVASSLTTHQRTASHSYRLAPNPAESADFASDDESEFPNLVNAPDDDMEHDVSPPQVLTATSTGKQPVTSTASPPAPSNLSPPEVLTATSTGKQPTTSIASPPAPSNLSPPQVLTATSTGKQPTTSIASPPAPSISKMSEAMFHNMMSGSIHPDGLPDFEVNLFGSPASKMAAIVSQSCLPRNQPIRRPWEQPGSMHPVQSYASTTGTGLPSSSSMPAADQGERTSAKDWEKRTLEAEQAMKELLAEEEREKEKQQQSKKKKKKKSKKRDGGSEGVVDAAVCEQADNDQAEQVTQAVSQLNISAIDQSSTALPAANNPPEPMEISNQAGPPADPSTGHDEDEHEAVVAIPGASGSGEGNLFALLAQVGEEPEPGASSSKKKKGKGKGKAAPEGSTSSSLGSAAAASQHGSGGGSAPHRSQAPAADSFTLVSSKNARGKLMTSAARHVSGTESTEGVRAQPGVVGGDAAASGGGGWASSGSSGSDQVHAPGDNYNFIGKVMMPKYASGQQAAAVSAINAANAAAAAAKSPGGAAAVSSPGHTDSSASGAAASEGAAVTRSVNAPLPASAAASSTPHVLTPQHGADLASVPAASTQLLPTAPHPAVASSTAAVAGPPANIADSSPGEQRTMAPAPASSAPVVTPSSTQPYVGAGIPAGPLPPAFVTPAAVTPPLMPPPSMSDVIPALVPVMVPLPPAMAVPIAPVMPPGAPAPVPVVVMPVGALATARAMWQQQGGGVPGMPQGVPRPSMHHGTGLPRPVPLAGPAPPIFGAPIPGMTPPSHMLSQQQRALHPIPGPSVPGYPPPPHTHAHPGSVVITPSNPNANPPSHSQGPVQHGMQAKPAHGAPTSHGYRPPLYQPMSQARSYQQVYAQYRSTNPPPAQPPPTAQPSHPAAPHFNTPPPTHITPPADQDVCAASTQPSPGALAVAEMQRSAAAQFASGMAATHPLEDDDDQLCVVCMEQLREVLLVPCGHLVLCLGCAEEVVRKTQACPICRGDIKSTVRMDSSM